MIKVVNLKKVFGPITALDGINLELQEGKFLTIFGPNGAGKTTLIKILSTLMKPTSGNVTVAGLDLGRETGNELRRKIGIISHNTYLYESLTAYENLKFYSKMYDVYDDETILQILNEVGLQHRMHDPVRTYSRGMQQRLSIARSLIHNPQVLFLDEPYTGLDQHATHMLNGLLKKVHDGERTLIMISHNLKQGLEICDRVAIQVKGKIVYCGDRENIQLESFEKTYFQSVESA